jgi:hypothetical protein
MKYTCYTQKTGQKAESKGQLQANRQGGDKQNTQEQVTGNSTLGQ